MKNHTLDEIKKELFKEIEELEEKDPFWKKCNNCPFKGKCCIDNDIDIREDEWIKIKKLLDNDGQIRAQVEENFRKERRVSWYAKQMCITAKYLSETVKQVRISERTANATFEPRNAV